MNRDDHSRESELLKQARHVPSELELLARQPRPLDLAGLGPRVPRPIDFGPPKRADLAEDFYARLVEWIGDFEAGLDVEHEVGVRLVSFGQALVFHLTDMSWWNPALIRFDGVNDSGEPVQLIQHVSQISVLLMGVQKQGDEPRRIGFVEAERTE